MTDQTSAPKSCSCLALALDRLRVLHELEGVYYVLPSTTRSSSRPIGRGSSGEGRYVTTLPESRSKISSWGYDGKQSMKNDAAKPSLGSSRDRSPSQRSIVLVLRLTFDRIHFVATVP
jgi:hypothetical protein